MFLRMEVTNTGCNCCSSEKDMYVAQMVFAFVFSLISTLVFIALNFTKMLLDITIKDSEDTPSADREANEKTLKLMSALSGGSYELLASTMLFGCLAMFLFLISRIFPLKIEKILMKVFGSINIVVWFIYCPLWFYLTYAHLDADPSLPGYDITKELKWVTKYTARMIRTKKNFHNVGFMFVPVFFAY